MLGILKLLKLQSLSVMAPGISQAWAAGLTRKPDSHQAQVAEGRAGISWFPPDSGSTISKQVLHRDLSPKFGSLYSFSYASVSGVGHYQGSKYTNHAGALSM